MGNHKSLNRIFAIFFAILVLLFMYYLVTNGMAVPVIDMIENIVGSRLLSIIILFSIVTIGFSVIVLGLIIESLKPSFDFSLNKDKKWVIMSLILFAVFILINIDWWIVHGIPISLPEFGWKVTILEFIWNFAMETSSLSLLFGILFLTNTKPQNSLSYKIILIGAFLLELSIFGLYLQSTFSNGVSSDVSGGLENYQDFWGYSVFQLWFWLDLTSEIMIFIGAISLLRRAELKKTGKILLIVVGLIYLILPLIVLPLI